MSPFALNLQTNVAGRGVERIEAAAVGAGVDALAPDRGRAVDEAAGPLRPAKLPARPRRTSRPCRRSSRCRRAHRPRRRRVELAAPAEPVLRPRSPDRLPVVAREGVEVAVVRRRRRGGCRRWSDAALDPFLALERPAHAAGGLVERVDRHASRRRRAPVGERGEDSVGPIRVRQRILPKPAENAITSPSRRSGAASLLQAAVQECLEDGARPRPRAGDATQRPTGRSRRGCRSSR